MRCAPRANPTDPPLGLRSDRPDPPSGLRSSAADDRTPPAVGRSALGAQPTKSACSLQWVHLQDDARICAVRASPVPSDSFLGKFCRDAPNKSASESHPGALNWRAPIEVPLSQTSDCKRPLLRRRDIPNRGFPAPAAARRKFRCSGRSRDPPSGRAGYLWRHGHSGSRHGARLYRDAAKRERRDRHICPCGQDRCRIDLTPAAARKGRPDG